MGRMTLHRSKFESEMQVRPDDIDLFRHVHSSKYLDYVLAARFDQMGRCYGMGMEEFLSRGLGWVVKTSHLEYKRPLGMAERFIVRTWVEDIRSPEVEVRFEILKKESLRPACLGWCVFTMIRLDTGRPEGIPPEVIEKYAV
jgi:acyl-CoA thioester hydrolase/thioesterase-3